MPELKHESLAPEFFGAYFPETSEVYASVDVVSLCSEAHEIFYKRVSYWAGIRNIVLGEGYTWTWHTGNSVYPDTISMKAPVVSADSCLGRTSDFGDLETMFT